MHMEVDNVRTVLSSLPQDILIQIASRLPFSILWTRIRVLGCHKWWYALLRPRGYPNWRLDNASWPSIGLRRSLPFALPFSTLLRLCIRLPGSTLVVSMAFVRSMPETLVEIDVEFENAETFLLEPLNPLFPPPLRMFSLRAAQNTFHWGFVNLNMGQRFPQLQTLRIIGNSKNLEIVPPNDFEPIYLMDDAQDYEDPSKPSEMLWTPNMAYNFIFELPKQTLTSLSCNWLIANAAEVFSDTIPEHERCNLLPFPSTLTQLSGKGFLPNPEFQPPKPVSAMDLSDNSPKISFWQQQSALTIRRIPYEDYWTAFTWPSSLSSLSLDCPLPDDFLTRHSLALPSSLTSFVGSGNFSAHEIPPGWFPPQITKLRLQPAVNWGKILGDFLPPDLVFLKISLTGTVDLRSLPHTLRVLKLTLPAMPFNITLAHQLPPKLHTMSLYSRITLRKAEWRSLPQSLTNLKITYATGFFLDIIKNLGQLSSLQMIYADISEEDLPKLPNRIQRLRVRSVILNGNSLKRFPVRDKVLTASKWNDLLVKSLHKSITPFWSFQPPSEQPNREIRPKLAMLRSMPATDIYFPPHVTEIDLRGLKIAEDLALGALAPNRTKITSLRLPSVSLSSRFFYPPLMTELTASPIVDLGQYVNHISFSPCWSQTLFKLVLPLLSVNSRILPPQLTYLDIGEIEDADLREMEYLQTLILRESQPRAYQDRGPLFLPFELVNLEWPGRPDRLELEYTKWDIAKIQNLEILHSSCLSLPLECIPGNVTDLHLNEIIDIPQELVAQVLQRMGHNLEVFDSSTVLELLLFYWFPNLQHVKISLPANWASDFDILKSIPDTATTIRGTFELLASDQLPPGCQWDKWEKNPAAVPIHIVRPMMEPVWARFLHLKVLNLSSHFLPHYMTQWLPRSLKHLTINNQWFTTRSYADLPNSLTELVLRAKVSFRNAFASALPLSLRLLCIPRIQSRALAHLPRGLQVLKVQEPIFQFFKEMAQLPPALVVLDAPACKWPDPS